MRCLEIICYGYLNKAESDWGIIGKQAGLFCDLHFPNRYDICLMTPGAWLIMLLAGFALFCILQMLHSVVLSFMPLLRYSLKICGVVYYVLQDGDEDAFLRSFSALWHLLFVTAGISLRRSLRLHISCWTEKEIIPLIVMYYC